MPVPRTKREGDDDGGGGGGNLTVELTVYGPLCQAQPSDAAVSSRAKRVGEASEGPRHPDDCKAAYNMKRKSPSAISGLGSPEGEVKSKPRGSMGPDRCCLRGCQVLFSSQ